MKIVIIILLFSYFSAGRSTFGDFALHLPIPTSTVAPRSSSPASNEPPVTDILETLFDFANDTLADSSDRQTSLEELEDEAITTPSPFFQPESICLNNRSVVVLRWLQQRLYKLGNAVIDLVSMPLEMVRMVVVSVVGYIGDTAFHLYGYDNPECRQRVMCEVSSFFANYLPQPILSLFERNWDTLVKIGVRLKLVDIENEYLQAAIIGAFEANCTIYDQATSC